MEDEKSAAIHCGDILCRNARKKTRHEKNAVAAQKCRKSETWLLTTSWLNAQQLYILQHSAPPSLSAMPQNNAAAMCVQFPKTIPQKRNGITELLQHLIRQLCQITPQLRQNTPQLLHKSKTLLIDLTGDVWKKRGCPNLQSNHKSHNVRSDLSERLPARVSSLHSLV